MNVLKYIEFLRTHMKTLRNILLLYLGVVIVFDFFLPRDSAHVHYWFDSFPDYWTLFSVIGCFVLIKVGKGIAHAFLSKDEDFYG